MNGPTRTRVRGPFKTILATALAAAGLVASARAAAAAEPGVVINEVFYNAPDDVDDLQWVEVHNPPDRPADHKDYTLDGMASVNLAFEGSEA